MKNGLPRGDDERAKGSSGEPAGHRVEGAATGAAAAAGASALTVTPERERPVSARRGGMGGDSPTSSGDDREGYIDTSTTSTNDDAVEAAGPIDKAFGLSHSVGGGSAFADVHVKRRSGDRKRDVVVGEPSSGSVEEVWSKYRGGSSSSFEAFQREQFATFQEQFAAAFFRELEARLADDRRCGDGVASGVDGSSRRTTGATSRSGVEGDDEPGGDGGRETAPNDTRIGPLGDTFEDELSDSESKGPPAEADDMYSKSHHAPGDGKRSTEEAWREYLDREEEFRHRSNVGTISCRASSLHKLIMASDPKYGNAGGDAEGWDDVRRFLREASDDDKKEAAEQVNELGRNALHLVNGARPPTDVVEGVIRLLIDGGRSDALRVADKYGSLPIHFACMNGASEEVVRLLIERGGRDTLRAATSCGYLPIHCACATISSEPSLKIASEGVIRLLIDRGGTETIRAADEAGRLPIHFACQNGASEEVVRLLIDRGGPETLREPDARGRLPLYCALRAKSSESVICLLLDRSLTDDWSPMSHSQKRDLLLIGFLDAEPAQRDICSRHPKVRDGLNRRFTARPVLAVMMTDLYMQTLLITSFTMASSNSISRGRGIETWELIALIACAAWFAARELIQMSSLNSYRFYVTDVWNWLDWTQIILISVSVTAMKYGKSIGDDDGSVRILLTVTTGVAWWSLLGVVKNFLYGIAIFLASLQQILIKLVPFIVVVAVTGAAFVFMLYTATIHTTGCDESNLPDDESIRWYCGTLAQLFVDLSAFVLSLSPGVVVHSDMFKENATAAGVLYFFGFLVALIFLNILIAKISNIFSETEQAGGRYFWENRLNVVAETESFLRFTGLRRAGKQSSTLVEGRRRMSLFCIDHYDQERIVRGLFAQDESKSKRDFRKRLFNIFYRVLVPILLMCFFLLGCVSFGTLWPKWMTEVLFFGKIDDDSVKGSSGSRQKSEKVGGEDLEQKITSAEQRIAAMEVRMEQMQQKMEEKLNAILKQLE